MPFFGQTGGAPPGAARNSMANYPPKGTGFAGTKPLRPAPNRFSAAPAASTGQDQIGAGAAPAPAVPAGLVEGRSFANNGSGAGHVRGGGYQGGGGAGDNVGGMRQFRQLRRATRPDGMPDEPPSSAMADAAAPAEPPAMPEGTDGPNQAWRAARRQAERQGLISQDAGGGFDPAAAGGEGADRTGMEFRRMRRQAKEDGSFTPDTGANRDGFGYRQDRRQAKRIWDNAKPGQPPAA